MGAAGLTHGGFYGHFESKDALAAIAVAHAFEQSAERWHKRVAGKPDDAARRAALVEKFLTAQSLKDVGMGCPTVALATDAARAPAAAPIRTAYLDGLEALVQILADVEDGPDAAARRSAALADYATMAGALLLARATEGAPLAAELLAAARGHACCRRVRRRSRPRARRRVASRRAPEHVRHSRRRLVLAAAASISRGW